LRKGKETWRRGRVIGRGELKKVLIGKSLELIGCNGKLLVSLKKISSFKYNCNK
jgi:hypothetical protein